MTAGVNQVTRANIVRDLVALGLEQGDEVVVHSSLSSIGWVDGGAETVVDALMEVVGPTGTIAVPTFSWQAVRTEPFDPATTASRTGAITDALRTRPEAHRSPHPTHSVSALGAAAAAVTAHHPLDATVGCESPLHRMAERDGKVLLIGVGHDSNTTLHIAERVADVPYTTGTREALVADEDGPRAVAVAEAGCSQGFPAIEPVAEAAGILSTGRIGSAASQLMRGCELIDLAGEQLAADPAFLLCDEPDCGWCPAARDRLREAGRLD